MTTRVVAYVPDLMDRSRISAVAPHVAFVSDLSDPTIDAAGIVVVDLARTGVLDALKARGKVIGFASHVDTGTIEAARVRGWDVYTRSEFFRRIGELLAGGL